MCGHAGSSRCGALPPSASGCPDLKGTVALKVVVGVMSRARQQDSAVEGFHTLWLLGGAVLLGIGRQGRRKTAQRRLDDRR